MVWPLTLALPVCSPSRVETRFSFDKDILIAATD